MLRNNALRKATTVWMHPKIPTIADSLKLLIKVTLRENLNKIAKNFNQFQAENV